LDSLITECTVLDVTEQTTHHHAAINVALRQAGKSIPTNDLWMRPSVGNMVFHS
jgi:predicted nucleic acid-binding protein